MLLENFGRDYIINCVILHKSRKKQEEYGKTDSMTDVELNIKTLLEQILSGPEEALRAWKNGGIPVQLLRELFAHHDTFEVLYFLAGYAETPSKILEELGEKTQSVLILSLLADHPRTPKPLLQQMAKHEDPEVRKAVARSKWISPQSALILSDDEDASVRAALAENHAITPRIQAKLSNDDVPFVRAALLKLPHLDVEIQKALCDDMDVTVQAKALLNPRLDPSCLLEAADSDESLSQRILLLRGQLPDNVLESLIFSSDPEIQNEAVGRKRLTADEMVGFAQKGDERVRLKIAGSEAVPSIVQLVLAEDESAAVRRRLAANVKLSTEAAEKLLSLEDHETDLTLAGNPAVPLSLLEELLEEDESLMMAFACRDGLCGDDLEFVLEHGDDSALYGLVYQETDCTGMSAESAVRLSLNELPSIRALAAAARSLPLRMMSRLSHDASPLVRMALTRNPEAGRKLLEGLCEDPDARVRDCAAKALEMRPVEQEPSRHAEAVKNESDSEEEVVEDATGDLGEDKKGGGLLKRLFGKLSE